MTTSAAPCRRGRLISVEGLNGVGKTYLTAALTQLLAGRPPLVVEEFSTRSDGGDDLGRVIIGTLFSASAGDPFLRSGHPGAETLALLAVKMFDFERCRAHLAAGRLVLEGRSVHSTAVYQSLICHPEDENAAYQQARALLNLAAAWRPMPDLTILVADDTDAAIGRAQRRDGRTYTAEQRRIHERAALLYARLALDDTARMPVLDRRTLSTGQLVAEMARLIATAPVRCLPEPWSNAGACIAGCRPAGAANPAA
ncbi:MAG TPA: thymidylate kinase [Streptosporangiaceae bacterium]|nr:thymidylate kinase [Streptosporangiaceae bacterium]